MQSGDRGEAREVHLSQPVKVRDGGALSFVQRQRGVIAGFTRKATDHVCALGAPLGSREHVQTTRSGGG